MSGKPWSKEKRGRQLEAFLGCWGVQTSKIKTVDDLRSLAAGLYEINSDLTVSQMAEAIDLMGKKKRKSFAEKNFTWLLNQMLQSAPKPKPAETQRPRLLARLAEELGCDEQSLRWALEKALREYDEEERGFDPVQAASDQLRPPW